VFGWDFSGRFTSRQLKSEPNSSEESFILIPWTLSVSPATVSRELSSKPGRSEVKLIVDVGLGRLRRGTGVPSVDIRIGFNCAPLVDFMPRGLLQGL
jgi:hypothetical protein